MVFPLLTVLFSKSNPAFIAAVQAIPIIQLRFNGEVIPIRPELPVPDLASPHDPTEDAKEANDVRGQVDQEGTNIEIDAEDGPDWMFEEDEV